MSAPTPSLIERAITALRALGPRRVLRHVLVALLGAYALYLLLINVFLVTPLLRMLINGKPDKTLVQYERAWSVWPGRVHTRGFRLRLKTSEAEVYVTFDRMAATFDVPSLVKKHLRVRDLEADGTTVIVRPRMYPEEIGERTLEGYAEVPGFSHEPIRELDLRDPPITNDNYKLWTFDLPEVHLGSVREIWIGPYRFTGRADARGGFYLRPQRMFALYPSRLTAYEGSLTLAKRPFGQDVRGTFDADIAMHDPRGVDGGEIFRHLNAHFRLGSAIADLGFLQRYLGEKAAVFVSGGDGRADSDVRVVGGVVQDGSWFSVRSEHVLIRSEQEGALWTNGEGGIRVADGEARVTVTLTDSRVERRWAAAYPIRAPRIDVLATTRSLDLARKPADDVLVSVQLNDVNITDVRALYGLAGKAQLGPGPAKVRGELNYSVAAATISGEASFEARRLSLRVGDVLIGARVAAGVKLASLELSALRGSIPHAYLDVRDANVQASEGEPPPPWWARVDVVDVKINGEVDPKLAGPFTVSARDARPIMHVVAAKTALPQWAREPLALEGLTLKGLLGVAPGIAIEKLEGRGGSIDIRGRVRTARGKTDGAITLALGPLNATVKLGPERGVTPGIGGGPPGE